MNSNSQTLAVKAIGYTVKTIHIFIYIYYLFIFKLAKLVF